MDLVYATSEGNVTLWFKVGYHGPDIPQLRRQALQSIRLVSGRERYFVPGESFVSKLSLKHVANAEWLSKFDLMPQFFCPLYVLLRSTNHLVHGNPSLLCLLIAGSPCVNVRRCEFLTVFMSASPSR